MKELIPCPRFSQDTVATRSKKHYPTHKNRKYKKSEDLKANSKTEDLSIYPSISNTSSQFEGMETNGTECNSAFKDQDHSLCPKACPSSTLALEGKKSVRCGTNCLFAPPKIRLQDWEAGLQVNITKLRQPLTPNSKYTQSVNDYVQAIHDQNYRIGLSESGNISVLSQLEDDEISSRANANQAEGAALLEYYRSLADTTEVVSGKSLDPENEKHPQDSSTLMFADTIPLTSKGRTLETNLQCTTTSSPQPAPPLNSKSQHEDYNMWIAKKLATSNLHTNILSSPESIIVKTVTTTSSLSGVDYSGVTTSCSNARDILLSCQKKSYRR